MRKGSSMQYTQVLGEVLTSLLILSLNGGLLMCLTFSTGTQNEGSFSNAKPYEWTASSATTMMEAAPEFQGPQVSSILPTTSSCILLVKL